MGLSPHRRQLSTLANLKEIPDPLYVLLRKYFPNIKGKVDTPLRKFEQPSFRP